MDNIFIPNQKKPEKEQFDTLLQTPNIHIEKITSHGQTSDEWYEQKKDEWVVLIEGEGHLLFEDGSKVKLKKGEYLHIPKMKRHKVIYTSSPAIWLAVHFKTEQ
jgi:cupin 2 domain-containing protein